MQAVKKPKSRRGLWIALGVVVVAGLVLASSALLIWRGRPVTYALDENHFKYGSITSDGDKGIPYWIWATLPKVCPGLLPGGYGSLGVVMDNDFHAEAGHDMAPPTPIGFSIRHKGVLGDFVGPNCALCHTASVRTSAADKPRVYLTAPAHQLNLMEYYRFQTDCFRSADFNAERVIAAVSQDHKVGFVERMILRLEVSIFKSEGKTLGVKFDSIIKDRPAWGPGRVDTFNPYKVLMFNLDMSHDDSIGTADFMSIWDQRSRKGLYLHWDGNNPSLDERNLSAALGAQATTASLNTGEGYGAIERIKAWIERKPAPAFPFQIDQAKAQAGREVYMQVCADCHDAGWANYGKVIDLKYLRTDPERNVAFSAEMAKHMNTIGQGLGKGPFQPFSHFRHTPGYASHPLDGIWLRAPYLHNGSVPTLADLLNDPKDRPKTFYRGYDVFDPVKVGFVSDVASEGGRKYFLFDTTLRGNGNDGHLYGLNLSPAEKSNLIEYLKTR